jgi:hypothetical protein
VNIVSAAASAGPEIIDLVPPFALVQRKCFILRVR